jgi:fido (protein-threonine AMPylation protein)
MTVALGAIAWEARVQQQGERTRLLILAQLEAYERLLDVINAPWPLTEAVIRELHRAVCKGQETYEVLVEVGGQLLWQNQLFPKGEYKRDPNNVVTVDRTVFNFCPPDQVPPEMHNLVETLASPAFAAAHPVLQASWLHYAFILIHPFADGNGRTARLLASLYFCKAASIPFLVFADVQQQYFQSLRDADSGNFQTFIEFCARCGQDAFNLVSDSLTAASVPSSEESLQRMQQNYDANRGPTIDAARAAAKRFMAAFESSLGQKLRSHEDKAPIDRVTFQRTGVVEPHQADMTAVDWFACYITTRPPVDAKVIRRFQIEMPRNAEHADEIKIWRIDGNRRSEILATRVGDILTPEGPGVRMRIEIAAERATREILQELATATENRRNQL